MVTSGPLRTQDSEKKSLAGGGAPVSSDPLQFIQPVVVIYYNFALSMEKENYGVTLKC